MPNMIEYAQVLQDNLDLVIERESTSGWMAENARQVIYNGGNTIKIPKISLQGYGNYSRSDGYAKGAVTFSYQDRTFTQDRGRLFRLDAMDVNETNFVATAARAASEFQRTRAVPEIDTYRYATLAQIALAAGNTKTLAVTMSNALENLLTDIADMEEKVGGARLIVTLSSSMQRLLTGSVANQPNVIFGDAVLKQGDLNAKLKTINDCPIVIAPQNRLNTRMQTLDGSSNGELDGGYNTTGSKINWLITMQTAPIAVNKHQVTDIYDPRTLQGADAYQIEARQYHDIWVMDNQINGIFANIAA